VKNANVERQNKKERLGQEGTYSYLAALINQAIELSSSVIGH
jgi:hypothetical protein